MPLITIGSRTMRIALEEHSAAAEFASLFPLSLSMEDYAGKEKIGFLPRKLSADGRQPFENEAVGDLAYCAPWGNLAIFYKPYRYSRGLVRLGRVLGSLEPLLSDEPFSLTITSGEAAVL